MARPETYTIEWADKEAETLADRFKDGQSVYEVCAEIGMGKEAFYKVLKTSVKFSNAYQKGLDLSAAWWHRLGREGADGSHAIQPATWCFNMKNRFGWTDRQQNEITGAVEISHKVIRMKPRSVDKKDDVESGD